MSDLTICDDEYIYAEKCLYSYFTSIELYTEKYIRIMNQLLTYKIDDSDVALKIAKLNESMELLLPKIQSLMDTIEDMGANFISNIDDADSFIY